MENGKNELKRLAKETSDKFNEIFSSALTKDERKAAARELARETSERFKDMLSDESLEIHVNVKLGADFWDLGSPRPRSYARAEFSPHAMETTEITDGDTVSSNGEASHARGEAIPSRGEYGQHHAREKHHTVVTTINGTRIVTDSYKNRGSRAARVKIAEASKPDHRASEVTASYGPTGPLISHISVRTRDGGTEFYGKFAVNARKSHFDRAARPLLPTDEKVPYFSFVPQYSHMNLAQLEFYKKLRESIKEGEFPAADLAYVLLYIYEIINLPDLISPTEGVELLAKIWLGYRHMHPRLDGYLCEWLPDYCMIGNVPLPESIIKIMPEIVPKAQFKEFYLNIDTDAPRSTVQHIDKSEHAFISAKTLIELASDYDFKSSKYYAEHTEDYEAKIPSALSHVMHDGMAKKRGMFSGEKIYKITRDSYTGAVASSGIKRLIDVEFSSFTRRADTRAIVTALVKYAENRLRAVLGIKAKLGVQSIDPADAAVIDGFFAPITPAARAAKEDLYMPEGYMKNYESEDSGFDFVTAMAIEQSSWANTTLLTGEETKEYEDALEVEGQLSSGEDYSKIEISEPAPNTEVKSDGKPSDDALIKNALTSALEGSFKDYCREVSLHEGELADRINTVFIDVIGDVVLEDRGCGFELIEDYREDIINWIDQ